MADMQLNFENLVRFFAKLKSKSFSYKSGKKSQTELQIGPRLVPLPSPNPIY